MSGSELVTMISVICNTGVAIILILNLTGSKS